jgi:hypothetical protein
MLVQPQFAAQSNNPQTHAILAIVALLAIALDPNRLARLVNELVS